jgi:hypothetical protein
VAQDSAQTAELVRHTREKELNVATRAFLDLLESI